MNNVLKSLEDVTGDLFVGVDIGRKRDLTVIWVLEKLENMKYTRKIEILPNTPYRQQEAILYAILNHPNFKRCCIDSTGMGNQFAEDAAHEFGQHRVEGIDFTPKSKEELAYNPKINFDDKTVFIPPDNDIREDLHSVKKVPLDSGDIRFDVEKSEASGHADRFWALALALYAAKGDRTDLCHLKKQVENFGNYKRLLRIHKWDAY